MVANNPRANVSHLNAKQNAPLTFNRCDADPDVLADYIIALLKNEPGLTESALQEVRHHQKPLT